MANGKAGKIVPGYLFFLLFSKSCLSNFTQIQFLFFLQSIFKVGPNKKNGQFPECSGNLNRTIYLRGRPPPQCGGRC